ncbi:hypothetical protein HO173_012173 [Letharia columbiana]|uniref:Rhodopsin domain-containing protein n=1 Tax=Letharia columbiana TaxID=112416 RepID=A0A8H6CPZ9_9LECA|nr:uncharacterized protein HO173_012173 [Letharia columbiana]KAF6227534.1 hypothetical protein HO173_012173 [Letharia columbiana]
MSGDGSNSNVYDQTRVPGLYAATITLAVLQTIAVVARFAARRISAATFWWDDYTIVLALILDFGLCVCYWVPIRICNFGRHTQAYGGPVTEGDLIIFFKSQLALQILYFATACAIKTSLILLYYRLFGVVRWFRSILAVMWLIVLAYFVADTLVAVFECSPIAYYWDKAIKGGSCIDQDAFYRWNGVANLLIDFSILVLPMMMVWRLNLDTRSKITLSGVFLLGTLACVASIVRVWAFNLANFDDFEYTITTAVIWTVVEQSVGIICACLPTLRPLLSRFGLFTIKSTHVFNSKNTNSRSGAAIGLSHLSSRPGFSPSTDVSNAAGFARLDEENGTLGHGSLTTHAVRMPSGDVPQVSRGILKGQTVEQHYDEADNF